MIFLCYFPETSAICPRMRITQIEQSLKSDIFAEDGEGTHGGFEKITLMMPYTGMEHSSS